MIKKQLNQLFNSLFLIFSGIFLALFFWIIETCIHIFIFKDGIFLQQLFSPETHELWMRSLIFILFILYGFYAQFIVNKLRKSDTKIKNAYSELEQIFQTAADGMRVIDKDYNVIRVNETFLTLIGMSKDEVIGKKCYEVFHGPVCHTQQCSLERIIKSGKKIEFEIEKKSKIGDKLFCIVTATPFQSTDGEIIGIVEDFKDITERKKAEKSLADEKNRLANTLKSIGDAVIATDIDGRVILMTEVAETLTGWMQKEGKGKHITEVLNIVDNKNLNKSLLDIINNHNNQNVVKNDIILLTKDGKKRYIEASVSPILDKNDNISGNVFAFRDITEKQKVEKELLKIKNLKSLGILAGGIAHDFNNILAVILGNISLCKSQINKDNDLYEHLKDAENATLQAKKITQQLLTFSKGGKPKIKTLSVIPLIKDTIKYALCNSNIVCNIDIPDNLMLVEADEGQFCQVIGNLVINAMQSMPFGGIIKIIAENIFISNDLREKNIPLKEGYYVKISVKDNGVGIPIENIDKIFDPYFTTKQNGNGIGLATVYSIIKKHNGYISVESINKDGTLFTLYIPASEDDIIETIADKNLISLGKKIKVLLMDDEAIVRNVIGNMLKYLGYEYEYAEDGVKAINLYQKSVELKNPYDLVILDLTVKEGMGGKDAITELLKIHPNVKAVISSGYSVDTIIYNYLEYGFKGVLIKPFDINELGRLIIQVINEVD